MTPLQESVMRAIGRGPRAARLAVDEAAHEHRVDPEAAWSAMCVLVATGQLEVDGNGGGILLVRPPKGG